ncbi:LacI family transcriptional regulator [Pokkaliibacter plantistimulans]|uniref:LacI family transcriptional regulator n=1 Tax=Proteobacteria bacterium 228 TaxID=2083153 RepID=A0A2S5KPV6_9PROT|nr:LacI family transcriptional regulator [Pokkaliibacter plantistimulans]
MAKNDDQGVAAVKSKRPTISDVAAAAGVGAATVDRVLNGRARVKPETARRILQAAEAINYRAANILRERVKEVEQQQKLGFLLLKQSCLFYQGLGRELKHASVQAGHQPVLTYMEDLRPDVLAAALDALAGKVDAVALPVADHPQIRQVVRALYERDIPVVTIVSDLGTAERMGFVGLDSRMAGRTAGWAVARLSQKPGKVGILLSSHRYACQDTCEVSFRSYFREKAQDFHVVEALISLEEPRLAQEGTLELLELHPDLVAIYVTGGGVEGVIDALRSSPRAQEITVVCNELTDLTRQALADGIVDLVISHPLPALAEKTVDMMVRAIGAGKGFRPEMVTLPFELFTAENIEPTGC